MSMKHPGRCTPCARVSLAPSKIPYGGFSPVRLQTGRRVRPSASHALYALLARVFCPVASSEACMTGPSDHWPPVQRPFARRRVMLSRPLNRYYGLICASRSSGRFMYYYARSLPNGVGREGPHFPLRVCVNVPPSVPRRTGQVHLAVASLPVQAFAISAVARHPQTRTRRFPCGSVSRLQSSLYATAR